MPPAPVPQFDKRQIGEKLETMRSELIACGRELRSMQGLLQGSTFVDDTLRMLDRLTCRIGVIGQVKAGKSSLINALTGKPGLLPTDVNPWTTAVTRIHFGGADTPPNVAAEFTFFEPDEWEQLANGAGQIRELTQSLVPGFKVELLHKQVDEMRRRTETRLGPELGSLLGKKHVYPLLSAEDIERYICATLPESATDQKGVYSDVIKTADLYFGRSEFGFPTTIIDTPGTNDPYLVRDEIARRTLESAHLHIVVLTPQQALSAADVALLRILRGLDKNRIMVFLNRIDQLGDPARDVPMIVQHIRESLRRELPGTAFPIVAGSAFWADAALRGSEADIERAWSAKAQAYAQHLAQQASPPDDLGAKDLDTKELGTNDLSAKDLSADDKAQPAQSLLTCSGLPALFGGLARLTPESHIGRVLMRVSQSFRDLARVGENAARHELAVLAGKDLPEGPEATVEELQAVEAQVKDTLTGLEQRGGQLLNDHCAKIDEILRAAMRGFSDAERTKLREAIAAGHHTSREWTCDFTLLRQQLEEALVLAYRAAEGEIRGIETESLLQLQQMLKRYNTQWAEPASGDSVGIVLPTIGTPSFVLSLDEPWWRRWSRPSRTRERRAAALARLIEHEFSAIIGALTQAARTQLQVRQTSALQEAELVYLGLIDLLKEQSRARLARQSASHAEDDLFRESPEMQRVRETQVAELKKQASEMSLLANRLESIDRDAHREDALAG